MGRLHDQDFYGWTQDQADALGRRSANEIDWERLQEELKALGQSQEDQLTSRLIVLIAHLLKWSLQPTKRTRSWVLTIREQRRRIDRLIVRNLSLKSCLIDLYEDAYPSAVDLASDETGLPEAAFSITPPLTFTAAMTEPVEWNQR